MLVACKLFTFVIEKGDIAKMMKFASKYPKLILDLRGNHGGLVSAEETLVGHFFQNEVKIADMVKGQKLKFEMSKPAGDKWYRVMLQYSLTQIRRLRPKLLYASCK